MSDLYILSSSLFVFTYIYSIQVLKWTLQMENAASPDANFSKLTNSDLIHLGVEVIFFKEL